MQDIILTREVKVSSQAVWDLLVTIDSWSEWIQDLECISLDDGFVSGSVGSFKVLGIPERELEIINAVPGSRADFDLILPLGRVKFNFEIEACQNASTRILVCAQYQGLLGFLYKFLTKSWLKDKLLEDLRCFTNVLLFKKSLQKELTSNKKKILDSEHKGDTSPVRGKKISLGIKVARRTTSKLKGAVKKLKKPLVSMSLVKKKPISRGRKSEKTVP